MSNLGLPAVAVRGARDRAKPMPSPQTEKIEIVVNGERREVPAGSNIEGLLRFLGVDPGRVAVERNREIVRKPAWNTTTICSGDEVEVVQFVGGG